MSHAIRQTVHREHGKVTHIQHIHRALTTTRRAPRVTADKVDERVEASPCEVHACLCQIDNGNTRRSTGLGEVGHVKDIDDCSEVSGDPTIATSDDEVLAASDDSAVIATN